METTSLPRVSLVIPVRNEGRFIEKCLESLAAQGYPRSQIEVVLVNDGSSDGTCELARHYAGFGWHSFRLVENERSGTAAARNTGLGLAAGELVVPLIGHCELAPNYLSTAVATLEDQQAECVGGVIETVAPGLTGGAIAAALSSRWGVGNARFRVGAGAGFVDTVAFGVYRREVFDRLGGYDETDDAGEDDEFNYRLLDDGGRIYLNPALRSRYHARDRLGEVVRQYYRYGRAKPAVLAAHPRQIRPRQLAPALLVGGLGAFGVLGLARGAWRPLRTALRLYTSFLAAGTTLIGLRRPASAPYLPAVLGSIHIAYGLGFYAGLWRVLRARL
jgi:succinoglycan biosynthesis protein ExoA